MPHRLTGTLFVAATLVLACAWSVHARDGRLRERVRERIEARRGAFDTQSGAARPGPDRPIDAPGLYRYTLRHDGLEREYLVHVPRAYVRSKAIPVVFALHGGGGHMELQADEATYGLVGKSEQASFIAVFPNGYSRMPGGKLATWNAGACCGDARDRHIDDVGFVRHVHADVARHLTIDRRRVFAVGMSNGGMMAWRLACEAPDLFRAIAAVAGTDNTTRCSRLTPSPCCTSTRRTIRTCCLTAVRGPDAFRDPSKVTRFTSVPATIAKWMRSNACDATPPRRILDRTGAWCEVHTPCRGDARVQLCVTETGGHSWPGGGAVRGKTPSSALSANEVMWDFFMRQ